MNIVFKEVDGFYGFGSLYNIIFIVLSLCNWIYGFIFYHTLPPKI